MLLILDPKSKLNSMIIESKETAKCPNQCLKHSENSINVGPWGSTPVGGPGL